MTHSRKQHVTQAFDRAAAGYDAAAAGLQSVVAGRLARRVLALSPPPEPTVLEIGCGTGLLSRLLMARIQGGIWLMTDLAPAMLAEARRLTTDGRARFQLLDGERPDLPPAGCDLVVSSLAMQWFDDLPAALPRLVALLRPSGRLVFATLGADTFLEWRQAHADLGLVCGIPAFPSAAALAAMAPGLAIDHERIVVRHADGRAFARDLAAVGARVPAAGHRPLTPGTMRRVLRRMGDDVAVTYHVLYGCLTHRTRE